MPVPTIFNLDQIEALSTDTVVSENGAYHRFKDIRLLYYFSCWICNFILCELFWPSLITILPALTFDDLGIVPRKLKGYPVEFLIQFRKGGPQYGSTVSEKVTPKSWDWCPLFSSFQHIKEPYIARFEADTFCFSSWWFKAFMIFCLLLIPISAAS